MMGNRSTERQQHAVRTKSIDEEEKAWEMKNKKEWQYGINFRDTI
jgi:hypothetical protein